MSEYLPDNWVVLKIMQPDQDTLYKVLGGWSGGYLDGDSWRLNSGVTKVKEDGDYYEFYGESGSCYRCHKEQYQLRMSTVGIYNQMVDNQQFDGQVQLMAEDTDWSTLLNTTNRV